MPPPIGPVAVTDLSGCGVPTTGSVLGDGLSEWAQGAPECAVVPPIEPLAAAPLHMRYGPRFVLRWWVFRNRMSARLSGAPIPPYTQSARRFRFDDAA